MIFNINGNHVHTVSSDTVAPFDDLSYRTDSIPIGSTNIDVIFNKVNFCPDTVSYTFTVSSLANVTLSPISTTICQGDTLDFTIAEFGQTSYNFFVDGSSQINSVSNTFTTSNLTNGQEVSVEVEFANGCNGVSDTATITVNDTIDAALSADGGDTFCSAEEVDLNATPLGQSSYQFFINDVSVGNDTNDPDYSDTFTSDANISVIITTADGCSSSESIDLTINTTPVIDLDPSTNEICPGGSVYFYIDNSNGDTDATYNFYMDDNGTQTNPKQDAFEDPNYEATGIIDGTEFWATVSQNGCSATSDIETINIVNSITAVIEAEPGNKVCQGETVTVTARNGSRFAFYYEGIWVNQDSSINTYTFDPADDGTDSISVFVRNGTCSDRSDALIIASADTPVASISNNAKLNAICDGECVQFTVTSDGDSEVYSFYRNGFFSIENPNNDKFIELCDLDLITDEYITVNIANDNCDVNITSNSINASPKPTIDMSTVPTNRRICDYDSLTLIDNGDGESIALYLNEIFQYNGNVNTPYYFKDMTGTQEIKIISTLGNCTSADSFTVTTTPEPGAYLIANDGRVICDGSAISVIEQVNNPPDMSTTAFTFAYQNQIVTGNEANLSLFENTLTILNPQHGDIISVKVDREGCSSNHLINIDVQSISPTLDTDEDDLEICVGDPVEFYANGGNSYIFNVNNIPESDFPGSGTFNTTNLQDGDFVSVTAYDTDNCTNTIALPPFTVFEYEISGFNYPLTIACAVDSLTPIKDDINQEGSWSITPSSGAYFNVVNGDIDLARSTPGDYQIIFTTNGLCNSESNTTLTVIEALTVLDLGDDQLLCNDSSTVVPSLVENGLISWNVISGNGVFVNNDSTTSISNLALGDNIIEVTVSNGGICLPNIDTISINVRGVPLVLNAGSDVLCFDDSIYLNAIDHPIPDCGTWTSLSGNIEFNNPNDAGSYVTGMTPNVQEELVWIIEDTFCLLEGRDTVALMNKSENISISTPLDSTKIITAVDFEVDANLMNYWSWIIKEEDIIINDEASFTHTFYEPGIYEITLQGVDKNGCPFEKELMYTIFDQGEIYVPSMFSPNNDGDNDEIGPYGFLNQYSEYSFTVYNRWGNIVFQSNEQHVNWNGKHQNTGNDLPMDGYSWMMLYNDEGGNPQVNKGYFILIR